MVSRSVLKKPRRVTVRRIIMMGLEPGPRLTSPSFRNPTLTVTKPLIMTGWVPRAPLMTPFPKSPLSKSNRIFRVPVIILPSVMVVSGRPLLLLTLKYRRPKFLKISPQIIRAVTRKRLLIILFVPVLPLLIILVVLVPFLIIIWWVSPRRVIRLIQWLIMTV